MTKVYGLSEDSIDYRKVAYKALLYGGSAQFNAAMGGGRNADGTYARLNAHAFYWTVTENDSSTAWLYNFSKGGQFINRHPVSKKNRGSFRTVCEESGCMEIDMGKQRKWLMKK